MLEKNVRLKENFELKSSNDMSEMDFAREEQKRFHRLFWEQDITILSDSSSSEEQLLETMKNIGFYAQENRAELLEMLKTHPLFNDELVRRAIEQLKIEWWLDDPIESRQGWETLEKLLV